MTAVSYHAVRPAVKPGPLAQAKELRQEASQSPRISPRISQSPRIAEGPFALAGEIRPGSFVYLYHRPDPSADGGFEVAPAYRLHVAGNKPLSCNCHDKRCTHGHEPRYQCKHMRALAAQITPVSAGEVH